MYSDLVDYRIEGWAYAERPTDFYEWLGEGYVKFKGDNVVHFLTLQDGEWHCDCAQFIRLGCGENEFAFCPHSLGLERALSAIKPLPLSDVLELVPLFHKEASCSL